MSKVINMVGGGGGAKPIEGMTAVPANVENGKKFVGTTGALETGTMPVNDAQTVTLDANTTSYTIPNGKHDGSGKVQISTQTKTATPKTFEQTISPDSGKVLTGVIVEAIQTETQTVTPSTSPQNVTPTAGKFLSSVSVSAVPTQTKEVTPMEEDQTVYPDAGKFLSSVLVKAAEGGKKVYTGTTSYGWSGETELDVGVQIKNDAIFFTMTYAPQNSGDLLCGCRLSPEEGAYCTYSGGSCVVAYTNSFCTYNGTKVTITGNTNAANYMWCLVQ